MQHLNLATVPFSLPAVIHHLPIESILQEIANA